MNPCPCRWRDHALKACECAASVVTKYQELISGSVLGRIDIHIEVPSMDYEKLSGDRMEEGE